MSACGPYPVVLDEVATLERVVGGASLARYGDGEFNLCRGHSIPCQAWSQSLQVALLGILKDSGTCLVGIPNLHSQTPKAAFWAKYRAVAPLLADREYGSAFISRPDSAPWIDTPEYWAALESLWAGKDVTVVRGAGSEKGLQGGDLRSARSVCQVLCRPKDAYAERKALLALIGTPGLVLLCAGPTATVLAVELCRRGVQAVDLGHVGLFLRKHRRGEPMAVTSYDRALA